jgi:hypothetical protein
MEMRHRGFDRLKKLGDKALVYEHDFQYKFSSSNNKLNDLVQAAFSARVITDAGIRFDVLSPVDIPDGDYDINVTAVPVIDPATGGFPPRTPAGLPLPPGLIPPPTDVVGPTTISVITNLIGLQVRRTIGRCGRPFATARQQSGSTDTRRLSIASFATTP